MGQEVSKKYQLFHIWAYVFGHNSAIIWPIGLIFYGNSGDYYLSIGYEISWFWVLFAIFEFLLGSKKGSGPIDNHMGLEPQNPIRQLTHLVHLLGLLLYRIFVPKLFDLERPPPLILTIISFPFMIKLSGRVHLCLPMKTPQCFSDNRSLLLRCLS